MPPAKKKTEKARQRIAIIGGGISGLATAYSLIDPERASCFDHCEAPFDIEIFERKESLGGNADTLEVTLGEDYGKPSHPPYERWVDLGVNDINLTSYERTAKAMQTIGFDHYKPLEDTICYFSPDGSVMMTDDGALEHGVSAADLRVPENLAKMNQQFMQAASEAVGDECAEAVRMTVAEFVADYRQRLTETDRLVLDKVVSTMLYPRISAMYFVDERGPQQMPLIAVMDYYKLQEGIGIPGKPKRVYFVGGSQRWIDRLGEWLQGKKRATEQAGLAKITIRRGFEARIMVDEEGAWVSRSVPPGSLGANEPECFDKVVMATHADDALRSFWAAGLSENVAEMLGKVSYTNSIAVAHTFSGVLPSDRNAWRTYNVMIRDGAAMTPYTMTYVINRHQNDAVEREYNQSGLPQFFVTLSPAVRIPDRHVLRLASRDKAPRGGYLKSGHEHDDRAIGWFKHNVLDFECLQAQAMLDTVQGEHGHRLYFAGGWTNGAGLHEQCFQQAANVADRIYRDEFGEPRR